MMAHWWSHNRPGKMEMRRISYPFYRRHLTFSLAHEFPVSLPTHEMQRDDDFLVTLTRRMALLQAEHAERMTYSLFVTAVSVEAQERGLKRVQHGFVVDLEQADRKLITLIEAKLAGHCITVSCWSRSRAGSRSAWMSWRWWPTM